MEGLDRQVEELVSAADGRREEAVRALKEGGAAGQEALARGLAHSDTARRAKAAWAFWRIGPDVASGVPALLRAIRDDDRDVRYWAVCALERLRAQGPALSDLADAVRGAETDALLAALEALREAGAGQVAGLLEELHSEDPAVRRFAAVSLGPLGEAAREAVPDLVAALKDPDAGVVAAAARALAQVEPDAPRLLRGSLRDPRAEVRCAAATALGLIDPSDAEALSTLTSLLSAKENGVRETAARALGSLGPAARRAVWPLLEAMATQDWDLWGPAHESLLAIGPAAGTDLVRALCSVDAKVRHWASWALERLGADDAEVVRELLHDLEDAASPSRAASAEVLGRLGEAARPAVPALTRALTSPDARLREAAHEALTRLGA